MTEDEHPEGHHPWEPPFAGTEAEHLVGALDRLRTTFRWKADELDTEGLQVRVDASALTLGGLLKHLATVEDHLFTTKMRGEPMGEPWDAMGHDGSGDWAFTSAADDAPDELYALWDGAVARSTARLDAALVEEYGRHTGHADLLREAVDGRVGEDPPAGWHARSGRRPS